MRINLLFIILSTFLYGCINSDKASPTTNEGLTVNQQKMLDEGWMSAATDIKSKDIFKVKAGDIIKVVNDAIFYMQKKYPYLYSFLNAYKVMYVPIFPSKICDSMCVDSNNNLWINMNFVYNECAMNKDRVFGILFHEMFHIFL